MSYRFCPIALMLLLAAPAVFSQEATVKREDSWVTLSREIVLPVVVHQPDCPLKLEFSTVHAYLDGGGIELHRFRNQGNKTIVSFKIAHLFFGGTGGNIENNNVILPGEAYGDEETDKDPFKSKMVPLTEKVKKELRLVSGMNHIIYYMVVKINFADGTVFDDEKTYKALEQLLEKVEHPQK